MGVFYSNFTLVGPEHARVLTAVSDAGRDAFVSPTEDGFTTVYDRETEGQDFEVIERVGSDLSRVLSCSILGVALHDDDVLYYWLFRDGTAVDSYNSCPDYFDPNADGESPPSGGDPHALCDAFGRGTPTVVEEILRTDVCDDEATITGEEERHLALAKAFGMPIFPVGLGYDGLDHGYLPQRHIAKGLSLEQFVRVKQA